MMPAESHPARHARGRRPRNRRRGEPVDGIVLLDKPTGCTSNQALQQVKRLFRAAKAGHTGSLDPLASGMLPVCLGQATKVSAFLLNAAKVYEVELEFGTQTETGDAEGAVCATASRLEVPEPDLRAALAQFRGEIQQVPPMYSALKHRGQRLYELARRGETVERPPRTVHINQLDIAQYDPRRPRLRVSCSKGTYIRSLVEDLAVACDSLAHVRQLRRLSVEPFAEPAMVSLAELEAAASAPQPVLGPYLLPADSALAGWPRLSLGEDASRRLGLGQVVSCGPDHPELGQVRVYGPGPRFLGIGEVRPGGQLVPRRLFTAIAEPGLSRP